MKSQSIQSHSEKSTASTSKTVTLKMEASYFVTFNFKSNAKLCRSACCT